MTLNSDKCEVSKTQLKFLGHIIDHNRVQVDSAKTVAVIQMPTPNNVAEVCQWSPSSFPIVLIYCIH